MGLEKTKPVFFFANTGATDALEMLLSTKCHDKTFNRYYNADYTLKVLKTV
jgi:hypothetical protein